MSIRKCLCPALTGTECRDLSKFLLLFFAQRNVLCVDEAHEQSGGISGPRSGSQQVTLNHKNPRLKVACHYEPAATLSIIMHDKTDKSSEQI